MLPYKLLDWIDHDKLDWSNLSSNPNAIHLLENNPEKIDWSRLSSNPNAIHILEKNPDKIYWFVLSRNPSAMHLLKKHPTIAPFVGYTSNTRKPVYQELWKDLIQNKNIWSQLEINTEVIQLLEQHLDKIHWVWLSLNPGAVYLLEKNQDKIDWENLSENINAIHLLEENPEKINWTILSSNTSAIHLLEKNPEKINWANLCSNPNALQISGFEEKLDEMNLEDTSLGLFPWLDFHLKDVVRMKYELNQNPNMMNILKKHPRWIDYRFLSENPGIFEIDYDAMKETKHALHEEFIRTMLHPKNISKFEGWGFESGYDSDSE